MNKQLRDAYYEYLDDLANAGIIDHALNNAVLEGKTVEEHVVEVLRAAGRLPEGWDREISHRGWQFAAVKGDHWRILPVSKQMGASTMMKPEAGDKYARLGRTYRDYAA
jgi:hypothetical protein